MEAWPEVHGDLQGSTKQRIQGLETLQAWLGEQHRLSEEQLSEFVNVAVEHLLPDNNHKVSAGCLVVLNQLAELDGKPSIQPYVNVLVPMVVERLGDTRQQVRQDACGLLLTMLASLPVAPIMERMSRFWSHKSWKVRHGLLQTMAEAVSMQTSSLLGSDNLCNHIVTAAVNMLEDRHELVREAAQDCLQELYRALGARLLDNLQQQSIRPAVFKDLIARLDAVCPTNLTPSDPGPSSSAAALPSSAAGPSHQVEPPAAAAASSSHGGASTRAAAAAPPTAAVAARRASGAAAAAAAEAPGSPAAAVVPVQSERELQAELQAMAGPLSGTVVDWQQRIALMQRLQGLAQGCPLQLQDALLDGLRQLREQLTKQVEDRRSAVSKAACALLTRLSSVLGLRFQDLLLYMLPTLAKVLPITVQVMAEAADACCVSLLTNCPSPKAVPLLAQLVKADKNAKIRACCTGYLAHVLETWDSSVCARCADDFEAAMQAACQDANGDARAAARRIFSAYRAALPEQARAFSARLPAALLDKLQPSLSRSASVKSGMGAARPFLARQQSSSYSGVVGPSSEPDIIVMAPPRPASAGLPAPMPTPARTASGAPSRIAASSTVGDGSLMPPLPAGDRRGGGRKSMAPAGRVLPAGGLLEAAAGQEPAGPATPLHSQTADAGSRPPGSSRGPYRSSSSSTGPWSQAGGGSGSSSGGGAPQRVAAPLQQQHHHLAGGSLRTAEGALPFPAHALTSALAPGGSSWGSDGPPMQPSTRQGSSAGGVFPRQAQ